jgi:lysozyme family protein
MYSEAFNYAFREVLELEGVFSNDPKDRGGKTKYGITEGTWLAWRGTKAGVTKSIEAITPEDAKAVYWDFFWRELGLDRMQSRLVATELFEAAVNCGPRRAVMMLQEAYNYCRFEGDDRLKVDGVLGPITRGAVQALIGRGHEVPLFKAMNGEQYIWYKRLEDQHHSRGWTRRLPG